MRTTARKEIAYGAVGDPAGWHEVTGIAPKDIEAMLAKEPASVQERWFARLYLLKAPIFAVLGAFWLCTGIIAIGPGFDAGMSLMREAGAGEAIGAAAVVGGSCTYRRRASSAARARSPKRSVQAMPRWRRRAWSGSFCVPQS